jgi:PAS domain S-box-containing protein
VYKMKQPSKKSPERLTGKSKAKLKPTKKALQESEEKYRLIAENTADLISILDMNLRFTYVSPASMRLRGFTVEEAMEQTLEQVLTPESLQLGLTVFEKEMQLEAGGTADPDRTRILELEEYKKDGSVIWMEVNLSFMRDKERKPVGILIVSRDITDRKRAEEALMKSEARLSQAQAIALLGSWEIDLAKQSMWGSEEAFRIYGILYPGAAAAFLPLADVQKAVHPEDRPMMDKALKDLLRENKSYDREFRIFRINDRALRVIHSRADVFVSEKGTPLKIFGTIQDITELKQAEEVLRQSEQRFVTIFNAQQNGILIIEPQTHEIVDANAAALRMIGTKREDVIGRECHKFICPAEKGACPVTNLGMNVDNAEMVLIRADHKELSIIKSVSQLKLGSKNFLIESFIDVTERKGAEDLLREHQNKLSSIFRAAPVGIGMVINREIREVNDTLCQMTGYSREELLGRSARILYPTQEDFDYVGQEKYRQIAEKSIGTVETRWKRKDGRIMDITLSSTPLDPADLVKGVTFTALDITDRKCAEEELRESEEKYRLLIENANEAVYVLQDGVFRYANRMCCQLLGVTAAGLIGMSMLKFVNPDDRGRAIRQHQRILQGDIAAQRSDFHILMPDGEERWANVNSVGIVWNGTAATLNFASDITERHIAENERRNLEARLQRAEKMEVLGQMAGGVAHDLNNVLGALTGYSELLLVEIPEGQRARNYIEKILQSTEKGAAIIQDLLTLTRRGVTVSEVINLNNVVAGFLMTPEFEKIKDYHPHVGFRTIYDKNILNIKGSPIHLEKALMNLVSNAAESISGAGEVTIRTENRYLDMAVGGYDKVKEGDYAILAVSDTGMGIPAENKDKIFEPFYTKKTMGRSGTGLGLTIVWGTVKDHNGHIDVLSTVGEGTTFTLYFPITRDGLIAPQQKEPVEQYLGRGESVLVVDDIAEQRDIASRMLTILGYKVHAVSSGEEAVKYLQEHKADILVLDMIMAPGIDGLETYQRVLEVNPKQKAILVSGFSESDRVREAQKLGAGAYVKKPYVMEKIGMAVRDELNR